MSNVTDVSNCTIFEAPTSSRVQCEGCHLFVDREKFPLEVKRLHYFAAINLIQTMRMLNVREDDAITVWNRLLQNAPILSKFIKTDNRSAVHSGTKLNLINMMNILLIIKITCKLRAYVSSCATDKISENRNLRIAGWQHINTSLSLCAYNHSCLNEYNLVSAESWPSSMGSVPLTIESCWKYLGNINNVNL